MNKIGLTSLVLITLSGCQSHPPQYASAGVEIKDNQPCFSMTPLSSTALVATAPTINKLNGSEWQTMTSPANWQPTRVISASHCTVWPDINWQAGIYDVVFKVSDGNNATRYATRFMLTRSAQGELTVQKQE
ncbi:MULTISPECIES: putative T6SS immunity periplasmic lipoprotein [Kosakonia]|uniref:putative T6SS immunity periplasmic lipoprotein n=1 Tax=Kosakonia TaxID=1330547 RepID=UPI000272D77C|nr:MULTISPECIES: putative T6SS immunity periplasmic lipoprotein [Kosakonia]NCF07805.1 hypothetical protein [Kosakonia sp. MH5]